MAVRTVGMSSVAMMSPFSRRVLALASTSSTATPSGTVMLSVSTLLMGPEPVTRVLMLP